jgi:transcriptional regulator with XRE-family HTH domain
MATHKWEDIAKEHFSPKERAAMKAAARAEVERLGYGALRKARSLTQVEIAEKLKISQPSVAAIERRSDLMLSTLAKYIRALGGELEINAVFPEATFSLAPPVNAFLGGDADATARKPARHIAVSARRPRRKVA